MTADRPVATILILATCALLDGCGVFTMTPEQRAVTIEFGRSFSLYGELLASETSYVRAEVKQMRVLAVSLPGARSAELFSQAEYARLGEGLDEPKLQRLVDLAGAAKRFGNSLAKVADPYSSTAEEAFFSSTTNNFVIASANVAQGFASVPIAAPAFNLITFVSTDAYRRRIIKQRLVRAAPTLEGAVTQIEQEFAPADSSSLLSVYIQATARLSALLESSNVFFRSTQLTAEERNLVATAYRVVGRNHDHIRFVASQQLKLAREASSAYKALVAILQGDQSHFSDIDRFSDAVFQTNLAFKSLR